MPHVLFSNNGYNILGEHMKHLLDIEQLSSREITTLIERALYFKHNSVYPCYPHHTLAILFYENSTRTRVSFELAANKLGIQVINLDLQRSSESKGETIEDTINTLAAMGVDLFVMRHVTNRLPTLLAEACTDGIHLINAGDGQHAHPTQALLDIMTIIEQKPNLNALKIAIVGDLRHSRVANSLQCIAKKLGIGELTLVAPTAWQPSTVHYGRVTTSLHDGIANADVVICLRVQQERLNKNEQLNLTQYHDEYAITSKSIKWAKPDVMVMHPGPINRGVELDSDVADGPLSFVLQQVSNGVFMRMAVLEALII